MGVLSNLGGIWNRMLIAGRAALTAFNGAAASQAAMMMPTSDSGWDVYEARLRRYRMYDLYYNNTVYSSLTANAEVQKLLNSLYKHIRPLKNPVARLVDLYVAKTYGGQLDLQTLNGGAIPIAQASDQVRQAIRQLWVWSNWNENKSLYVRNGAIYGDSYIKIVDDPQRKRVRMEALHPGKIVRCEYDEVGNIRAAQIEYDIEHPEDMKRTATYTEMINNEQFATFLDGELYAFNNDANGKPIAQWDHGYGFVPLVHVQHKNLGLRSGVNPYHSTLPKINEVNDSASLLNDQIRKVITPLWYFAGVGAPKKPGESTLQVANAETGDDERDQVTAIYGPIGSKPEPMIAPLDIVGALKNIDGQLDELERDMPELALHRIREQSGSMTAPGVRAGYSDAIDRILEARGNYDGALIRAQQMALTIGGLGGYKNFEGFDINSYENGELDHYINERPVIEDQLSVQEKIAALGSSGAPSTAIWREMGYSEDQIKQWQTELESTAAAAEQRQQAMIDSLAAGGNNLQAALKSAAGSF